MISYKAAYRIFDDGVHAEVLDFPGAITAGADLDEARRMLAGALTDMAETHLLRGQPLPAPDSGRSDPDADIEEPIHLILTAASGIQSVPRGAAA